MSRCESADADSLVTFRSLNARGRSVPAINTNRDLYAAVSELIKRHENTSRSLEAYLSALWSIGRPASGQDALAVESFFQLLATAFEADVPKFDESWRSRDAADIDDLRGFDGWEAAILRQIVDLHEMDEAGTLADETRYFGVNSPRGNRWYNFDPCVYLECATQGAFGGWQPDSDTGRDYVPGSVVAFNESGELKARNPREADDPVVALSSISWDAFRDYLWCGQSYE